MTLERFARLLVHTAAPVSNRSSSTLPAAARTCSGSRSGRECVFISPQPLTSGSAGLDSAGPEPELPASPFLSHLRMTTAEEEVEQQVSLLR